jgi:hypothetical protein
MCRKGGRGCRLRQQLLGGFGDCGTLAQHSETGKPLAADKLAGGVVDEIVVYEAFIFHRGLYSPGQPRQIWGNMVRQSAAEHA